MEINSIIYFKLQSFSLYIQYLMEINNDDIFFVTEMYVIFKMKRWKYIKQHSIMLSVYGWLKLYYR